VKEKGKRKDIRKKENIKEQHKENFKRGLFLRIKYGSQEEKKYHFLVRGGRYYFHSK
jgi:hypothetical protein